MTVISSKSGQSSFFNIRLRALRWDKYRLRLRLPGGVTYFAGVNGRDELLILDFE
jgi:hypothetical protein